MTKSPYHPFMLKENSISTNFVNAAKAQRRCRRKVLLRQMMVSRNY
jgi:hypothetical protein